MQEITIFTYVLDDDKDDLFIIGTYLHEIPNCVYSLHSNVEEFLAAVDANGAHIAIIDFNLSAKVNGIEVGRAVLEKNPNCVMILLSGLDDKESLGEAMNTGFRFYVDKNKENYMSRLSAIVKEQLKPVKLLIQITEKYKTRIK